MFLIYLLFLIVIIVITFVLAKRVANIAADELAKEIEGKGEEDDMFEKEGLGEVDIYEKEGMGEDEDMDEKEGMGEDEDMDEKEGMGEDEEIGELEENEGAGEGDGSVVGSYELVENKKARTGKIKILSKPNFTKFLDNVNLSKKRLILIVGVPYSGVSELARRISKKFGHKIIPRGMAQDQRKEFFDKPGKFVIENCEIDDLDTLFKGKPVNKNFVLLFVHPKNNTAVGRLARILMLKAKNLREKKSESGAIEELIKIKEFLKTYGKKGDREKMVKESEALLEKYGKKFRVYAVKNSFDDMLKK